MKENIHPSMAKQWFDAPVVDLVTGSTRRTQG